MSDELTRAIAEALGCEESSFYGVPVCVVHGPGWPCRKAEEIAAALAPLIEARVREALPEHLRTADSPCSRCGTSDFPVWFTDSTLWNAVVRSAPLPWMAEREQPESDGFMCPNCFIRLVDERGLAPTGWRLLPEWHRETCDEMSTRKSAYSAPDIAAAFGKGEEVRRG